MHCAMYKVFQGAQVRIAKKWFFRVQKEKKFQKQLIKQLRCTRVQLNKEKEISWRAGALEKDLERKDGVIHANNAEIEEKNQELEAKDLEITDLKSDLKDILEEKRALECK